MGEILEEKSGDAVSRLPAIWTELGIHTDPLVGRVIWIDTCWEIGVVWQIWIPILLSLKLEIQLVTGISRDNAARKIQVVISNGGKDQRGRGSRSGGLAGRRVGCARRNIHSRLQGSGIRSSCVYHRLDGPNTAAGNQEENDPKQPNSQLCPVHLHIVLEDCRTGCLSLCGGQDAGGVLPRIG